MFHGNVKRVCRRHALRRRFSEEVEQPRKHTWRGRNKPIKSTTLQSGHGIIDLQRKYGEDFQHIQFKEAEVRREQTNWKEQREVKFVKDMVAGAEKDKTLSLIDEGDGDEGKRMVPFSRVQERQYNWNPYQETSSSTINNQLDAALSEVPESYRQGGFGMQVHPRWNSRYWKIWPSQRLMKRAVQNGRNIDKANILYNPLLEGGQREDDVAGSNYIDIFHPNQQDLIPSLTPEQARIHEDRFAAKRYIQEMLEGEEYNEQTLPPYKSGFEDVPVKKIQNDFWFPGYDTEMQRRRELRVKFSILVKHIRPALTSQQIDALEELMKLSNIKRTNYREPKFNRGTGEITLTCKDCYTREENERRVLEWFTKLINEARKLGDSSECRNWQEYEAKWKQIWAEEDLVEKQKKLTWRQRMLATPEYMRKNANLYLAGPRMRKSARYADKVYDKMVDCGTILQREGPRSANPLGFWKEDVPMSLDRFRSDVDDLPDNPDNFPKWLSMWKDIYQGKIDENTKAVDSSKYGMTKRIEGNMYVAPAESTRLKKAKARQAIHNWSINRQKNHDGKMNRMEYEHLYPYWMKNPQSGEYGEIINETTGEIEQNSMGYDEASKFWLNHSMWGLESINHLQITDPLTADTDPDKPLYPKPTPHIQSVIKRLKILPTRAFTKDRMPVAPVFKKFVAELPPESMKGVRKRSRAKPPTKDDLEEALRQRERESEMVKNSVFFQNLSGDLQRLDDDKMKA